MDGVLVGRRFALTRLILKNKLFKGLVRS